MQCLAKFAVISILHDNTFYETLELYIIIFVSLWFFLVLVPDFAVYNIIIIKFMIGFVAFSAL